MKDDVGEREKLAQTRGGWFSAVVLAVVLGSPMLAGEPTINAAGAVTPHSTVPALYARSEVMIPMRDGVRLQTVILTPPGQHGPLPILLRRTPYGAPENGLLPDTLKALAADGYIFVVQNIRGRFKSEGRFSRADDMRVEPGRGTPETRDAWDTVDWLVKHVPNNNGRVGIYGVSYDGDTAAATLLGPHPALKAVSEQASPVDEWMNDDEHRYRAFRLSYAFEYAVLEEAEKAANTHFAFDTWDTYIGICAPVRSPRSARCLAARLSPGTKPRFTPTMIRFGAAKPGPKRWTARRCRPSTSPVSGIKKTLGDRGRFSSAPPGMIPTT